jgi:hypothetical protein
VSDDGDIDREGGDDSEGGPSCPYCVAVRDCEHQILFWSGCNGDWNGVLAEGTESLQGDLIKAIWSAIKRRGKQAVKEARWPAPLDALINESVRYGFAPQGPDHSDWYGPVRTYWCDLADQAPGSTREEWSFDSENPAVGADSFGIVFAQDPHAAVSAVRDSCRAHVELLTRFADCD